MAGTGTKCPVCGKSMAIGLVSQTLLPHENKIGERCAGSGKAATASGARTAAVKRPAGAGPSTRTSTPSKGGVTVRRVEVDPEIAKERAERSERLREERAEAARARNEIGLSYFDEPRR